MSELIHGHSVSELRAEVEDLKQKYPSLGEAQLRVYMVGKYGISHDNHHRLIPISLEEVFRPDPEKEK